jgi:hypothetical protein
MQAAARTVRKGLVASRAREAEEPSSRGVAAT